MALFANRDEGFAGLSPLPLMRPFGIGPDLIEFGRDLPEPILASLDRFGEKASMLLLVRALRQKFALFPPQGRQLAGRIEERELTEVGPGTAAPQTRSCRSNTQGSLRKCLAHSQIRIGEPGFGLAERGFRKRSPSLGVLGVVLDRDELGRKIRHVGGGV